MKLISSLLLSGLLLFASISILADTRVEAYTRNDGTHVQGHYRSAPNSTVRDNFSYYGNRNPYTSEIGTNKYRHSRSSEYYTGGNTSSPSSIYSNPSNYNTPSYDSAPSQPKDEVFSGTAREYHLYYGSDY